MVLPLLELTGASLHYDEAGAGTPLLFLHGVGSTAAAWRRQLSHFAGGYRVLALDLRGHGRSQAETGTISLAAFAADAAALLRRPGIGPAHVCGLSLGGIVALQLWADAPELVRSLVLADTWALHPDACRSLPQRLDEIDGASMAVLAESRMPRALSPGADPALVRYAIEVMAAKDKAAYRRSNEVLWCADMRSVAASVRVPAAVLVGGQDRITPPELSRELAGLIPGAGLHIIASAGHLTNEESPVAFNRLVEAFLQEV